MPKNLYYAMNPENLESFIAHKSNMQEASKHLTAEKIQEIKAEIVDFDSAEAPRGYFVEDGVANIPIVGPLMPKRDICSVLFDTDMTTYSDIFNSIKLAENDETVEKIVFNINSPGGSTVALTRTAERIKAATKPTVAYVTEMAASAAYWLASQANTIIAEHSAVEIGSIGVYCEAVDRGEMYKANGIQVKAFRSANAPMKNPDPFTREGEDDVVKRLTQLESVFFDYIASGRQASMEDIKENYGKGGILIAGDALNNGMIDAIETIDNLDTPIQVKNNINPKTEEDISMSEKIEMTQEQLDSAISQAASKAVEQAMSAKANEDAEKLATEKAESDRIAGFSSLLAGFPEQSEMIKAEMEKGSSATADFAVKVSAAETTRLKVASEASENDEDVAPEVKPTEEKVTNSKVNSVAKMCIDGRA